MDDQADPTMTDSTPHRPLRPSRRGLLLGGAALGAGAAIAPLTAGSAAATTGTMTVVTANIRQTLDWDRFLADLDTAAANADLLGLNEAFRYPRRLAYWAAVRGFHIVQAAKGEKRNGGTNVLLARASRFDPRTPPVTGHEEANPGGNPDWKHPRPTYIDWAVWRERATGIDVVHVNTHTTRGIEAKGKPNRSYGDGRVGLATTQLKRVRDMAAFVTSGGYEAVVTGDLNVDWAKDRVVRWKGFPFAVLEGSGASDLGLRSCYSMFGLPARATQGRRYIDYVYEWVRQADMRRIAMTSSTTLPLEHSDHEAVIATFNLSSGGHAAG